MDKKMRIFLTKTAIGTIVVAGYVGASLFFVDNFYFGSTLGNMNIGGKSVEAVSQSISQMGQNASLTLYGKGAEKQVIEGRDIELTYSYNKNIKELKKTQPAFLWPKALLGKKQLDASQVITYDEGKLNEKIDDLSYFNADKVIEPENAKIVFNGSQYEIKPEKQGRKLNKEKTKEVIIEAIKEGKTSIDLEKADCYEKPEYTSDSPEIMQAQEECNKIINTKVTYLFGDKEESITPEMLEKWVVIDDDDQVSIDEQQVEDYINELGKKYNSYGVTRKFKTSKGTMGTVTGGDYGWAISSNEIDALIKALKAGEDIHREPIANKIGSSTYIGREIGNSYVEINLTKQYLWCYKNGKLVAQGSVVTGDKHRKHETPQGTYCLTYKERNATLTGPNYATPVSFWMPFNKDIGIHDAVWRSKFGGKIYETNGSHGCVNVSYQLAQNVYNNIDKSMPIICYY